MHVFLHVEELLEIFCVEYIANRIVHSNVEQLVFVLEVFKVQASYRDKMFQKTTVLTTFFFQMCN
jgi:hypothetical protein